MPLTYHFRPFPVPEELRAEPKPQPTSTKPSTITCPCQMAVARCKQCRQKDRQERSSLSRSSQTTLPSIKEELDPLQRSLTPKEIRDQRRTARISVSAALHAAAGSEDYFTFYHDGAFARSPAASSGSAYRSGRNSRKSSAEKDSLLPVPNLEASDSSDLIVSIENVVEGEQALPRRES